jgi:hypothetical protein
MLQDQGGDLINKEDPTPLIEKVPEAKDCLSTKESKIRKIVMGSIQNQIKSRVALGIQDSSSLWAKFRDLNDVK